MCRPKQVCACWISWKNENLWWTFKMIVSNADKNLENTGRDCSLKDWNLLFEVLKFTKHLLTVCLQYICFEENQKYPWKIRVLDSFLSLLKGQSMYKQRTPKQGFDANFKKFFRIHIPQNSSGRLFLKIDQ